MSNSNPKKAIFLAGFFLLPAALCIAFYYVVVRKPFVEKNAAVFKKLPYYGPRFTGKSITDTIFHTVPEFNLVNSVGEEINKTALKGNLILLNFFYTGCRESGPRMATHLLLLQKKIAYIKNVKLISITADPSNDNVKTLKDYAFKVHSDKKMWQLCTGNRDELSKLAFNLFLIDTLTYKKQDIENLKHNNQFILIDKDWHIRGYYKGTSTAEANRIMDEARLLDVEYKLKKKQIANNKK